MRTVVALAKPGPSGLARVFALVAWLVLSASCASAHQRTATAGASGLEILGLTHGQMAVIAEFAPAIRAAAQRQAQTDPTYRRLLNFAALQRTYCLWGLVPGSVADEESPFNECMHAYLSALHAVLTHMQDMPGRQDAARTLNGAIAQEMARRAASDAICQYSDEAFNTAEVIVPQWRDIAFHLPSLFAVGGTALLIGAAGSLLLLRTRPD